MARLALMGFILILIEGAYGESLHCIANKSVPNKQAADFLKVMNEAVHISTGSSCANYILPKMQDSDLGKLDENVCLDVESFCDLAVKAVSTKTNYACAWGRSGITCPPGTHIPDFELIRARKPNFDYAEQIFYTFTHDSAMQKQCCGTNQACMKEWASTKFQLDPEFGENSWHASTFLGEPKLKEVKNNRGKTLSKSTAPHQRIEVSAAMVANCTTQDCIDGIILHELGHACDMSNPDYDDLMWLSGRIKRLEKLLDKNEAKCIEDALASDYETSGQPPENQMSAVWVTEAYADAVFADRWHPSSIAIHCMGGQDSAHSAPKTFLSCLVNHTSLHERFCPIKTLPQRKDPKAPYPWDISAANPAWTPAGK